MAQTIPCADIRFLIEQSASGFNSIQADSESEHGGFNTTTMLPEAEYCVIFEDPEKRSYQCTWKYPLAAEQASTAFEKYAEQIGHCVGNASRVADQAVNHPDTYRSYLYKLSDSEVRVTLKNKSELMSTLVSVFVAGVH